MGIWEWKIGDRTFVQVNGIGNENQLQEYGKMGKWENGKWGLKNEVFEVNRTNVLYVTISMTKRMGKEREKNGG